jgi:hypothetical protein
MELNDELTRTIAERVTERPAPVPNLAGVRSRGRGLRRRRVGAVVAAVAVVSGGGVLIGQTIDTTTSQPERTERDPISGLDYSEGLRAFASPDEDGEVSLGGRTFPRADMQELDTQATATPQGLLFYDREHQVQLLAENGTVTALAPAPDTAPASFRGSSKADAQLPLVAFTQPGGEGFVNVLLHDLDAGRTVSTRQVPCEGRNCEAVLVDAVDRGLVFVRTGDGTYVWDPDRTGDASWTLLGDDRFRVADAHGGAILWAEAAPDPAPDSPVSDWRFIEGAIDAQLSFDGRHVLSWSPKLEPTTRADDPIRLDVDGAIWFTFDTDGSVLAAAQGGDGGDIGVFYDCEIPSGRCSEIGTMPTVSGDPMFIGDDM